MTSNPMDAFGPQLLHILRTRHHHLGPADKHALQELIERPTLISSEHHQQSLHALVGLGNGLDRYVDASSIAARCMLPLLIWAKPTNKEEHIVGRVPNWAIFHTTNPHEDMENAKNALVMINALREELTEKQLHSFADFWQEERKNLVWNNIYSRPPAVVNTWVDTVLELGLLHGYTNTKGLRSAPSSAQRWAWWLEKSFASMTNDQQTQAIRTFLKSPLPSVQMLRACTRVDPHVWLDPNVHAGITAHLPAHEYARWQMLPLIWDTRDPSSHRRLNKSTGPGSGLKNLARQAQLNRDLTLLYCPKTFSILDALLVEKQWRDRPTVDALMHGANNKNDNSSVQTLDLPALD